MKMRKFLFGCTLLVLFFSGGSVFADGFRSLNRNTTPFKTPLKVPIKPGLRLDNHPQAQLKLIFKQFNSTSGNERSLGDRVMALLEVENHGQTTESVRVHYMVGRNPTTDSTGILTLNPGQKLPAVIKMQLPNSSRSSDRNIHFDQPTNYMWWTPAFALRKVNGAPFTDSNMADNVIGPSDGFVVPLSPKVDLAVVGIEGVRLMETWRGGVSLENGTTHPVSLDTTIKIRNNGLQNSPPMNMAVNLMSVKEAITEARSHRNAQYTRVGRCAYWPQCSMTLELTVPAIPVGQTRSFPVHFAPIPHSIERAGSTKMAGGPYACGRGGEVLASTAKISATLRTADEDIAFMHNNSLTKEGKFAMAPFGSDPVTCGFQ